MMTKWQKALLVLSPYVFYVGYGVYHCLYQDKSPDGAFILDMLFGITCPFWLLLIGMTAMEKETLAVILGSLTALASLICLAIYAPKRIFCDKIWIWVIVSWGYLILCFWCGEFIAGV